jgi:hypothetical protein
MGRYPTVHLCGRISRWVKCRDRMVGILGRDIMVTVLGRDIMKTVLGRDIMVGILGRGWIRSGILRVGRWSMMGC